MRTNIWPSWSQTNLWLTGRCYVISIDVSDLLKTKIKYFYQKVKQISSNLPTVSHSIITKYSLISTDAFLCGAKNCTLSFRPTSTHLLRYVNTPALLSKVTPSQTSFGVGSDCEWRFGYLKFKMTWKDTFKVYWMKERDKTTNIYVSFSSLKIPNSHLPFWGTFWLDWPWSITFIRASCNIENRLSKICGMFYVRLDASGSNTREN